MAEYEKYEHHGVVVTVRADLKGRHRGHCLCFSCKNFHPGADPWDPHCDSSNELFEVGTRRGMTAVVWECPKFVEGEHA